MRRTRWGLLQILLFLFALNSVSLVLYFISHHHHNTNTSNNNSVTENSLRVTENSLRLTGNRRPQHSLKPWPIMPSYLPWSPDPKVVPRSCEAYFGNGFTRRIDLLPSASIRGAGSFGGGGWFRCFCSETLGSSICEGGKVRMVPERIKMSRGGERLEEVAGRREEDELPEFEDGAFELLGVGGQSRKRRRLASEEFLDQYVRKGEIMRHTIRELLNSVRLVEDNEFQCDEWIEEPTLFVTRFEYANLFHTVTDWYSAYVSSRVTGLPIRPRLIFLDGHCKAPLEQTWKALFSGLRYTKNFSGPVCFHHAILSPLGYETALFKGLTEEINCQGASAPDLWKKPDDQRTARLSEFGEIIRAAFGFPVNLHRISKPALGHNVLFVRREDYLAHPRHGGKVESRLSNEQQVFDSLQKWASNYSECKINLVNGLFAHMSMREQVQLIQDASVIIGAHGAGLTHIVAATPKTVVLEIISSQFRRPHFSLIAQWKGLEYHAINLPGSFARPAVVIERLGKILRSLEC